MIVVIRYTDCLSDKRIVFGTLAKLNIKVIKSRNYPLTINHDVFIDIENDLTKLSSVMYLLNKDTTYGVSVIKIKQPLKDRIKILKERWFKNEKSKDIFNG